MARSEEFQQRIAEQVRSLRQERGMSQADLVERLAGTGLGWHQQTVAKVERGTRPLRLEEAIALASVLGVDVPQLYESEDAHADPRRKVRELRQRLAAARFNLAAAERRAAAIRATSRTADAELERARAELAAVEIDLRQAARELEEVENGESREAD